MVTSARCATSAGRERDSPATTGSQSATEKPRSAPRATWATTGAPCVRPDQSPVDPDVVGGHTDEAVHLAGHHAAGSGRGPGRDPGRCPSRPAVNPSGELSSWATIAMEPSNDRRHAASAWSEEQAPRASRSPIAKGMTLCVGRDLRGRMSVEATGRMASWLSTSPLNAAMTYSWPASQVSALLTGWAFAWLIRPTLAHRVCATTVIRAEEQGQGAPQVGVAPDGRPEPGDVVPQPPDEDSGLVDEREAARDGLDRAVAEQRVRPFGRRREGREVRRVGGHEDVDAGRVAAAHLEAAERVQDGVDRAVAVGRGGVEGGPGQCPDAGRGAE